MKVKVTEKEVIVTEVSQVNEGDLRVNMCQFELPESFNGLNVVAIFNGIPAMLVGSECFVPTLKNGDCILGVYAYKESGGEMKLIYSPRPTMFYVDNGSLATLDEEQNGKIPDYDSFCLLLKNYWEQVIELNTIPEYSPQATEKQYYSAKALNEMYAMLQGGLDEIVVSLVGESVASGISEEA